MSDDSIKDLNRKIGALKAKVTNFNKFLNDLNIESLSEEDILNLEQRQQNYSNILSDFESLQTQLEIIAPDDKLDELYENRNEFEDQFNYLLAKSKSILLKNSMHTDVAVHDSSPPVSSVSAQSSDSNSQNFVQNMLRDVKFPVINLPTFDGRMEKWLEFRDTYESLVHSNSAMSNIQKYHYLRASLQEGASQVIRSLELSAQNYPVAWQTLCDRYNNNKLLIHIHTKALFSLETLNKENANKLRELVDDVSKHLRSLEQLNQPVEYWDTLINFLVSSKLDKLTIREWEEHKITHNDVTWTAFKSFLKGRADMLETVEAKGMEKIQSKNFSKFHNTSRMLHSASIRCPYCQQNHSIYKCEGFNKISPQERINFIRKSKLCSNCLKAGHFEKSCKFGSCRRCNGRHNTLIHIDQNEVPESSMADTLQTSCSSNSSHEQVLLSTVTIKIFDALKRPHIVRALLDSGSQSSFIREELASKLGLNKSKTDITISGFNHQTSNVLYKCEVSIQSCDNKFESNLSCLVIPEITTNLPNFKINKDLLKIPHNIRLADPAFNKPGPIQLLIGADLFWHVLSIGQINLNKNKLILQKTLFGWIISGKVSNCKSNGINCHLNVSSNNEQLNQQIAKFWEIEEFNSKVLSNDERFCEEHFRQNTRRDDDGRFIVSLPLKASSSTLGDSRQLAQERFLSTERKMQRNIEFQRQYLDFMREYQDLGHMTLHNENSHIYYLPHHGVLKEDSLTTKLRVVFDASAPTTTGISLNDIQGIGPVLQNDLLSIMLRFRTHQYVVGADIAKMYRQIQVDPNQRYLQCILWRDSPHDSLKTYQLNTVTYGQAASSFLATRCLFELAKEIEDTFPHIANIIRRDFYMDDLLTGSDSKEEAINICNGVYRVLNSGCFPLRKWFSNEPDIIQHLDKVDSLDHNVLDFSVEHNAKTLGLMWNGLSDHLIFKIDSKHKMGAITKRSVLSQIAQIFDPLGLLAPCTILAKLIMQRLWMAKLTWDESLPAELHTSWVKFSSEVPLLNAIKIPRLIKVSNPIRIELHGFCDASQNAYGSCIFMKSTNKYGDVDTHLYCAKSKVAPLKTVSIPRLELCGALLLSKLLKRVVESSNLKFSRIVLWTDSSIVLGWLNTSPHLLKTFVSNRVSEIQAITKDGKWRHVPTKDNPADLITRGIYPSQIPDYSIWWQGPSWLRSDEESWPKNDFSRSPLEVPERKTHVLFTKSDTNFLFGIYSNISKLKRIVAYLLRFKHNCSCKREERKKGVLTSQELNKSLITLSRLSQIESFNEEYNCLLSGKILSSKSKLLSLNPFMDNDQIVRVGGRLRNSPFSYGKKHPILISSNHIFTKLLFQYEHVRLLHTGAQSLLNSIRQTFWPISGRNIARNTVRKCTRCFRFDPKTPKIIMADLPRSRFSMNFPFSISGTDYAGPFYIRNSYNRRAKLSKCYVCLFVCFSTRAIHLELVSDLTANAFIQALRRFVSRRGKPSLIYSDNGSNYIKASKELKELGKFLISNSSSLEARASKDDIEWRFIPPSSPHFGGIWEAGIKSTKHHLKRVISNARLTFEDFYTLLTQIEAVLNSRPLHPLSSDPNDLNPLTPAHFLIGRPATMIPDPDVTIVPVSRLSRYQMLQKLNQHFWSRWSKEYISELQQRQKWKQTFSSLEKGHLVLIKDDNLPPTQWKLGRITQIFPGKDNVCRVAEIKTADGFLKRSFAKICPLPIEQ